MYVYMYVCTYVGRYVCIYFSKFIKTHIKCWFINCETRRYNAGTKLSIFLCIQVHENPRLTL